MATSSPSEALAAATPDARKPIEYWIVLVGFAFPARMVEGDERLGRPFRFHVKLLPKSGALLEPQTFIRNTAVVEIYRFGTRLRRLIAVSTEAALSATATGAPEMDLVLEPRLSILRFRKNSRIFRNKTVPEIVTEVMREREVGVTSMLTGTYPRRPYCVQYNETDLDFVHRLLEEEGIFYRFPEFLDDEERPDDVFELNGIVLGDQPRAYEDIIGLPELPFHPGTKLVRDSESVIELHARAVMGVGKVSMRDWNLERPSEDMDVEAAGPTPGSAEHYDFPGGYETPDEGRRLIQIRAESMTVASRIVGGTSDCGRLGAGRRFVLSGAPPGVADGRYTVIALHHHWKNDIGFDRQRPQNDTDEGGDFELAFEAIPADVTYRCPQITPSPVITNPLTGFVMGPEGADIHTDEYGRVKVFLPWDSGQAPDDNASHWIPVLQDNTGTSSAIPRVGWEVVLGFTGGDPDRPFVMGRVYNGQDPFPEPLPANKTKTALRSLSSPGRDGQNEIWIEDAAGRELVSVQAEKDQNVVVDHDKTEDVLNTEENTVLQDETIKIGRDNTVTVDAAQMLSVEGNQTIAVAGSRRRRVGGAEDATIHGSHSMKIGGSHLRRVGGTDNVMMTKSLNEKIGGVDVEASLGTNSANAAALHTLTVGGAVIEIAGQGKIEGTDMLRVETIGMALITKAKSFATTVRGSRSTTVGGVFSVLSATIAERALATLTAVIDTVANLDASEGILIESGGSSVSLTATGITMKTNKDIVLSASGSAEIAAGEAQHKEP